MSEKSETINWKRIIRRWIYMAVAIGASTVMFYHPVFNFQEDKGIIYIRTFEMNQTEVTVIQTELEGGAQHIVGSVSVTGLYYCQWAMLAGCILCLLCFFSRSWRMTIALITALIAGAYYGLLIFYAMRIADEQFATLFPNFMVIFPAIVCQMMILVRHNIIRERVDEDEREE